MDGNEWVVLDVKDNINGEFRFEVGEDVYIATIKERR
jgi:hypothetical protein